MNDQENSGVAITAQNVAVDTAYYWREMADCPVGSKVQLLTAGGLPQYGRWDGKNPFYVAGHLCRSAGRRMEGLKHENRSARRVRKRCRAWRLGFHP
jgi:hypothetical protein